ncbi:MAG: 7TM domain-containing protein, partial [Bacteroidota bacterium]
RGAVLNVPFEQFLAPSGLTDAVMALENNEASCNGKSRLFVALCRNMGIPARLSGGLILEDTTKKTSHLWAEVYIGDEWVPFDALNGHFASLPAHYMELYKGDEFLIRRTAGVPFNYQFQIRKKRVNDFPKGALLNVWDIIDNGEVPVGMIMVLLLLPLGTLLMGIFKNIIGLQTFGVFLPILIGLAFINTGLLPGLILFTSIVLIVALIHFPLEKWGIQYNAKIALILTAVVVICLFSIKLLHETHWYSSKSALFFPIIMVSIVCERFAKKIDEEGLFEALKLYMATLVVTLILYFILSTTVIQNFIITFPEIIFSLAGFNLLLGKWIGLRLSEYYRFQNVVRS